MVPIDTLFAVDKSRAHGHINAVRVAMSRLKLPALLSTRPSRERDLVCAMIAARIIAPHTKLATTRWWHTTTLPEDFGVADASENDLYAAMGWLLARQGRIQKKLAARHLQEDSLVLYDLSSSYFEGKTCPLARLGYSRDGKKGKTQVNYGLLTDARGCPVAVSVYAGNTADPQTLMPEIDRLRNDFGIAQLVMVERAFRTLKSVDLRIRPIHHRLADRVRAHIFLCVLAYYVEWHLREAWRELLFADTPHGAPSRPNVKPVPTCSRTARPPIPSRR